MLSTGGSRTAHFALALTQVRPRRARSFGCSSWNPQNVDNPQTVPSVDFSPRQAVEVQLEALRCKDEPWYNHGLLLMYEFALDVGGLDRSTYFGYAKDLYHFDHFMGHFANTFGDVINHRGFTLLPADASHDTEEERLVIAQVENTDGGVTTLQFIMKRKAVGGKKGCWMTATLQRV